MHMRYMYYSSPILRSRAGLCAGCHDLEGFQVSQRQAKQHDDERNISETCALVENVCARVCVRVRCGCL